MADSPSTGPPPLDPRVLQGLVFDLDGTLVDSYGPIAASLNHARRAFGLEPLSTDEIRRQVGHGLERLVHDHLGEQNVSRGVRLFREHYAAVYRSGTRVLAGALHSLHELRARGYRLSVASNKPARFGGPILEALGILPLLDHVAGPDLTGDTKPEPTMLRSCLRAMGVERAHAAYVGDMVLDVETAARAGLPVILVRGGSSSEIELRATGQTVLPSIDSLLSLLPRACAKSG